jgi:MoaA/NifB/PqqE/SkfB family radical SAM enzyme
MRLAELGFVNLHIRGGNPFLEWERLLEILDSASRYPHLRVAVTTPGTGRSVDEITRLCKDYPNVRLNIVLFGWTENTGSHRLLLKELGDCQFSLLDTLRQGNAKFSIAVNFSDRVPADTDCVSKYTLDRWGTPAVFAEFYPWSRQVETDPAFHFLTVRNARKPLYLWRNPWEFFHRIQNNSCLYGAIEIAVDGSIRPCAGCLDDCGKISEGNISVPLADSIIYELWRTTKSDIETCRDCALRVACADCLSAERLGARNGKVAVGYCSVMNCGSLYKSANLLQPNDSVYLLSVHDGLELCPK